MRGEPGDYKKVIILFRPEQREWLRAKAYVDRTTVNHIVRELVDEAMKKEPLRVEIKR